MSSEKSDPVLYSFNTDAKVMPKDITALKSAPKRPIQPISQAEVLRRGSSYYVENSKVSREMICQEDEDGEISCVLADQRDDIKFSIDHFADNEDVLDDYMAKIF